MVLLLIIVLHLLLSTPLQAEELSEELLNQIESQRLYDSPSWRALIHLPKGTKESYSRDEKFFLSRRRDDPRQELISSVRKLVVEEDKALLCRFPARVEWLYKVFRVKRSPAVCPELEGWIADIAPKGATLVFADAFMNNPASMFGHTFLRIDNHYSSTPLLAYGSHYAAHTGEDVGPAYALKGIFGGYHGYFSLAPYYQSVSAYNDIERRDLWEYQLNLSEEEVRFLLKHLWELRGVPFGYYYFDENCSYHLLGLLDVARPGLQLQEKALPWVIPVDTLKIITKSGVVAGEPVFRAARTSKLIALFDKLDKEERQLSTGVARGEREVAEVMSRPLRRGLVLDAAFEYLDQEGGDGARKRSILSARSKVEGEEITVTPPVMPPHGGHPSRRVKVGGGVTDSSPFASIELRPSYHSLEDPSGGYADGLSIELLAPSLLLNESGVEVERFTVVNLLSLYPWDEVFRKISWGATLRYDDLLFSKKRGGVFDLSLGVTTRFGPLTSYTLLGPRIEGEGLDVAPYLRVGGYGDLSPTLRILGEGYGGWNGGYQGGISLAARLSITERYSLMLEGKGMSSRDERVALSLLYYW